MNQVKDYRHQPRDKGGNKKDARAALDGTNNDNVGLVVVVNSLGNASTVVNADANTIAFSRTTAQVLKIVYAGGSGSGGFFPAGLNGTIK